MVSCSGPFLNKICLSANATNKPGIISEWANYKQKGVCYLVCSSSARKTSPTLFWCHRQHKGLTEIQWSALWCKQNRPLSPPAPKTAFKPGEMRNLLEGPVIHSPWWNVSKAIWTEENIMHLFQDMSCDRVCPRIAGWKTRQGICTS